jgi:hypothetical protein
MAWVRIANYGPAKRVAGTDPRGSTLEKGPPTPWLNLRLLGTSWRPILTGQSGGVSHPNGEAAAVVVAWPEANAVSSSVRTQPRNCADRSLLPASPEPSSMGSDTVGACRSAYRGGAVNPTTATFIDPRGCPAQRAH